MGALIDPKPGDAIETPDGRLRFVWHKYPSDFLQESDVLYTTSKQPGAKVRNCWITTWRAWCKKHGAIEVSK